MDVTRSHVKLLVGGAIVLGGLAFPASLIERGIVWGALLVEALGSVVAGNTASAIDALIDGKDSDRVSLENEDLTKAVGKAIAAVITLAAKQHRDKTHDNLEKIAIQAKNNWVKIAQLELTQQRYPQLREAKLDQFLTPEEYSLTQDGNLTAPEWQDIFIRLNMAACKGGGFQLPPEVYPQVAELLHTTFPKILRQTLKEDFAKDGKAFAGLTLQLLTGMKAELAQLRNTNLGVNAAELTQILQQFQQLETQLRGTVAQQQAFFSQISQDIDSGFAEVCQQLGVMETNITALLQNLEKRLDALDEKLARLEAQGGGRQLSKQEYRSRESLLKDMRAELAGRKPLDQAVLLNLGKEQQPHQVQRLSDVSVKVGEQRSFQLPSETSILEVFKNPAINGKFLILGKPGGGKTTTLLELAQALVERAETDSDALIPVILELSEWRTVTKRKFPDFWNQEKYDPSIKEWILSQLRSKGVSQEIGEQWIREKELVLLLDGLDELPSERQAKCVRAINEFLDSEFSPLHLVVCSRKEEYEEYEEVLHLNGAICLEDLTVEQMRHYFASVNLGQFWESIKDSEKIVNFIHQPLFLAITSIAYQQIDVEEWRNCNTEERAIDYLLGIFRVLAVSQGTGSTVILSEEQRKNSLTNRSLIWLAKYLEISRQSDFVVHKIQPYLLLEGLDCYQTITCFISRLVFCFWMYIVIDFPTGLSFLKNFSWSNFLNFIISSLKDFYFSWGIFFKVILIFFKGIFSSYFILLLIYLVLIYLVAFVLHQILFNRMDENYRHITINEFNLLGIDSFYLFFKELFYRFYCCLAIISGIYLFIGLFGLPGAILDGSFIKSILDGSLFFTFSKFVMFLSIICAPALAIFYASTGKLTTDKEKINPTTNYLSLILNVLFLTTFGFFYYTIVSQIFPLVSWHIVLMASVYIGIFLGGGYEIFKYFILRLILFKFRYMPWNITRFLDYCTKRLILQRVGNRYRFIHRLVLEHFANLEIQKE